MKRILKAAAILGMLLVVFLVFIIIRYKPNHLPGFREAAYSFFSGEDILDYKIRKTKANIATFEREEIKLKKLYYYIMHPEEAPKNVRPDIYKLISDLNKMPSDAQGELLAEMAKDDPSNDKIEILRKRRL